ncbi:MAG TPA: hypothetical protein VG755_12550 [Nannocystaceae bacterium]|nr:hypothetical protein [Nannocystaceae bacterium]
MGTATRLAFLASTAMSLACNNDGDASSTSLSGDGDTSMTTSAEGPSDDGPSSTDGASEDDASSQGDGPSTTPGDDDSGSDSASEDSTGGVGPTGGDCDPLPPPEGDVIEVGPGDDLPAAIANAASGTTLMLADGTYDVSGASYIVFAQPGVTLRSQSGNPEAVVIDGGYTIGSVFEVTASDVTIAEVTIQRPIYHPIHVTGGDGGNTENTMIYRVRVIDPGQQAIKINATAEGRYADYGTVACSHLELTDEGRNHVTDCYTGGIDAHLARGWVVRDNHIEGFWCAQGLSEHGVHVWNSGRDTLVERNTIVDCARGVGFGLGESGNGTSRDYGDDPCPGVNGFVGHYGGTIRNNMIIGDDPELFASQFGMDSGVALEQACNTAVVHNTVVSLGQPFVSMEYRFANTHATIGNNLTTHGITMRDGASAELPGNMTDVGTEHFVDAAAGDLHLAAGSTAADAGMALGDAAATQDFDGDPRDGTPDVGANERVQ